ncbi:hypothetical protein GCM10022224_092680 [Nonomuraea antimicrobica]|uniref:Adhesin n=1 Tax=Nonomuraea antimicrobica TaxID=561173 RepID=A0ABP7E2U6_9ACTN
MRAAWLAAGAVVTVFALVLSTAALWVGVAGARMPMDVTMRSIPFNRGDMRIETGRGQVDLIVLPGKAGELVIDRALRWSRDRPTVTEEWDARSGTLRLDAVCSGSDQPQGPLCRADYTVYVPPEIDLEASASGGVLDVGDLFGSVRLTSVSGDVSVRAITGDLWARTETGSIRGMNLSGRRADVEVGWGNVSLTFAGVPAEVRAVVRTVGDVDLTVPDNLYAVTTSAANITLDVRRDADAPRKITAEAPKGSVSVCCR